MTTHTLRFPSSQKGAALIIALAMLVIMTMLAISAMATSNLQLLMAGNAQQQTEALARSENALFAGQNYLGNNIQPPASPSPTDPAAVNGYVIFDVGTGVLDVKDPSFWSYSANYRTTADSREQYTIEYLANRPAAGGQTLALNGLPAPTRNIYRVSARGTSQKGAVRTLQAIAITEQAPN